MTGQVSERPVPMPDSDSQPFWDGAREHRLLIQRCKDCGRHQFYPRIFCQGCLSDSLAWVDSQGMGHVYTYTVARVPASPAFAAEVPYVVAMVQLPEGVRLVTNIVDCSPEDVHIGMPVEVTFREVSGSCTLPVFRPTVRQE